MIDQKTQEALDKRLAKIEGQIRGIRGMVAEPRLCVDTVTQIAAVHAALKKVGDLIVTYHLQGCMKDFLGHSANNSEEEKRVQELLTIFHQFYR